jgi:hypothetical protein
VGRISLPKREDVGGPERPVVVPIDHVPRIFTLIEAGEAQVAELNLPDHRVMLQAQRWPSQPPRMAAEWRRFRSCYRSL